MNAVEVFLVEAMGTAVIDTARTRTVCGERWLDNYLKTLDELSLKKWKGTLVALDLDLVMAEESIRLKLQLFLQRLLEWNVRL